MSDTAHGDEVVEPEAKRDYWKGEIQATVEKWHNEADKIAGLAPDEVLVTPGNVLLNAGITRLLNLATGAGGQAWDATHSRIGVGDSSTAAVASQTDLQAATNKLWNLVTGTPGVSSQSVSFVTTFVSADANFAWNEWAIDQGTAQGTTVVAPALDRKVASMGTKASGAAWTITITITLS